MKLAVYVGTRKGIFGIGNRLIRARLKGEASHCEIVFEPSDNVNEYMPDGTCQLDEHGLPWCFSSVGFEKLPEYSKRRKGKLGGARFKRIGLSDSKDWILYDVPTCPIIAARLASELEGSRYDWTYILSFVSWFIKEDSSRVACSEICAILLGLNEPHRFDPCTLAALAKGYNHAKISEILSSSV